MLKMILWTIYLIGIIPTALIMGKTLPKETIKVLEDNFNTSESWFRLVFLVVGFFWPITVPIRIISVIKMKKAD